MIRVGVDLGGTKVEAAVIGPDGGVIQRMRRPTPEDYDSALILISTLVDEVEAAAAVGRSRHLGVGTPGCVSPRSGLMENASTLWLNGRPFAEDLARASGRQIRVANDANCFALSEAVDGAARGALVVLGLILGTGCGGGIVVRGSLVEGARRLAGEIGHTPLPWPTAAELRSRRCWCGRHDCLETYVSGPAFAADYKEETGRAAAPPEILSRRRDGETAAVRVWERYVDRLARGLAGACGLLDPDVVVLGGGMSNAPNLCEEVSKALASLPGETPAVRIVPARHGDASGVRGAAWLWEDGR